MISMVWPDIVVTMSPGRCALPSGMFSTRPMAPTALTLRLARGERMHQADDAGGARHVALHFLHAAGGLDRDAAGVEADALADEGDRLVAFLAAVPAHDHHAAGSRRALRDAEQRAHAELGHRLHVEDLDLDAELAQLRGALGEFLRIEDIRRLVDEVARDHDAVGDAVGRRERLLCGGDVLDRDRDCRLQRASSSFFLVL